MVDVGIAARRPKAVDVGARGGDVRVADAVTAARPVGDRDSVFGNVGAGDGDQERIVGRRCETVGGGAVVAGAGDDDDAGVPCPLECRGQGVTSGTAPANRC